MAKFTVDLTDETPETIDRGRDVEPGWYKAVLEDVYDDEKKGQTVLQFTVQHGPYRGVKVFDRLNSEEEADSDSKADMIRRRVKLLSGRLGLVKQDAFGRQAEIDFTDAISTECVLQVTKRKFKNNAGEDQEITSIAFDGVYPPDHRKIPADVRKALGLPAAATDDAAAPGAAAKANGRTRTPAAVQPSANPPVVDVSDL